MGGTAILTGVFVTLPLLALLNALVGFITTYNILRDVPKITEGLHLRLLKRYVSLNMYQALAQIVFLVGQLVAAVIAFQFDDWPISTLLLLAIPMGAVLLAGLLLHPLEERVRSLPVSDELRAEYEEVVFVWKHRPFPTW